MTVELITMGNLKEYKVSQRSIMRSGESGCCDRLGEKVM